MQTFKDTNLNDQLILGLSKQGINSLTQIQSLSIPEILSNKDVIAESFTGSGKTLAYLLPIFQNIDLTKQELQSLIIAPTHELVMQIEHQIKLLSSNSEIAISSLPVIGDVNLEKQIKKIKDIKPQIIVGTTGRVMDLIKKKKIKAHTIKTLVLDEADNLLDNTSSEMVKDLVKKMMRDTQILIFSATINNNTLKTANEFMKNPLILKSTKTVRLNPNIEHYYIKVDQRDKFETLRKLIAAVNPEKALVFINKSFDINLVTSKLNFHNKKSFAIHKGLSKEQRQNALESFRSGKINILVSSDISARGLDIDGITHVINLDFPKNTDEYLHRAGRTARGENSSGFAISLVTFKELSAIRIYENEFNIKFEQKILKNGNLVNA